MNTHLARSSQGVAHHLRVITYAGIDDERRALIEYLRSANIDVVDAPSTADVAIIWIDAQKGILATTRRHTRIAAMMGIRHLVFVIHPIHQVAFSAHTFNAIEADCRRLTTDLQRQTIQLIPLSELTGGNIPRPSEHMGWYTGPTLIQHLNTLDTQNRPVDGPEEIADQFEAKLLWMSAHAMTPGRQYLMKLAAQEVTATITAIKYQEDIDTGAHLAAKTLALDGIATVNLSTSAPLAFEPSKVNRVMGGFTLMDPLTRETVGAGMIEFALRRASNIHWQALELSKAHRAAQKHQHPQCIWFTGLSGSGKSTLANLLEKRLHAQGKHTYLLDGDNVRHGLNRDLGFTEADRVENIRRVTEVAKLMVDAGLIVLVSFISPYRAERLMARQAFQEGEFIEVFVDTPLEICEQRDVKGLYAKARKGELKNFTGIDSPYEPPESPEIHLRTVDTSQEDCIERISLFTTSLRP